MPRKGEFLDITGNRYGKWLALQKDTGSNRKSMWICICDCGTKKSVFISHLRRGATKSCGCSMPKGYESYRYKHGMSNTPEFKTWLQIMTRCYNPKVRNWENYGGKGVKVCKAWKDDFLNFFRDMGERPSTHHSIDRLNIDGDYSPDNCRWATRKEQARNTTRTAWVEYKGRKMSLSEACEITGIPYSSAQERRAKGMPWEGQKWHS